MTLRHLHGLMALLKQLTNDKTVGSRMTAQRRDPDIVFVFFLCHRL